MKKILANNELKSFLVLLCFSFLLLLLDHFQVLQPVKAYSEKLFLPPKRAIYRNWQQARDRVRGKDSGEIKRLEEKIKSLEQEMAILQAQNSELRTQNSSAQRLLGTPLPPEWQFIPAQTAGLVDGILTIDKGQADGIKAGQAVLVEDVFVGKVKQVSKYQAWVELPVAKNSKLLAKVIPSREVGSEITARGLLVGYGGKMRLEKVLQEEMLAEGDLVVTGEFPPNLVIGKITKVIKKDVEIYQEAEVEPLVDYQQVEVIFLLK